LNPIGQERRLVGASAKLFDGPDQIVDRFLRPR
jgi:hypothetical protein